MREAVRSVRLTLTVAGPGLNPITIESIGAAADPREMAKISPASLSEAPI
jgi:hypothetical protein